MTHDWRGFATFCRWFQVPLGVLPLVVSCSSGPRAADPPMRSGDPVGLQMLRSEAQLRGLPFRTLLDFEAGTDVVFVNVQGPRPVLAADASHTGQSSLLLESRTRSLAVRLGSLFAGQSFPGRWTLAGAYFLTMRSQRLTASYEVDGTTLATINVEIPPGQWTPVLLDLARATEGHDLPPGVLRFAFPQELEEPVRVDDVLVIDNTRTLVDTLATRADGWSVRERGFRLEVQRPGMFRLLLDTPEASADGWTVQEANGIRVCLLSPGDRKTRVIYWDGRQIIDGRDAALSRPWPDHANPATLVIPAEMGRLDRNSAGDGNNDGYCEQTGTYRIIAGGPRLELRIIPPSGRAVSPILEIDSLPEGAVLATMEGLLIERIERLPGGRVLLVLPGVLERETLVSIRVQQPERASVAP